MNGYEVREYVTIAGKCLFRDWLNTLDVKVKTRVQAQILRLEQGNLGDHNFIGDGVWETRLMFSAGYRIYYALEDTTIVLLLQGGRKDNQSQDIRKAKEYGQDYSSRG